MSVRTTRSICSYCGVGCGVLVHSRAGRVVGVSGDPDHPANYGELCSKGRELHETVHLPNRLLYPELRGSKNTRRGGASWDSTFDFIAGRLQKAISEKGPDSVGLYVSGQLLTEDYYAFNKFAKGFLGTNNIDSNSRLCMSSAVAGYKRAFGADAPPACYDDIESAELIVIVGANMAWCHPVLFKRIQNARERETGGPRVVVLDPRKTATARLGDLHVPLKPGTDLILLHGLLAELARRGRLDSGLIEQRTKGFEALAEGFSSWSAARVCDLCGISRAMFDELVAEWESAASVLTFWAMGVNQSAWGTDTVNAITNLHLATGQIGKSGAGPFSLTGQPNAMGGREVGGLSNLLSAHRDLGNPAHRAEVERIWNSGPIRPESGLSAVEMFEKAAEGQMEVLWIACTNPAVSMPNQSVVRRALEQTPLVVVQDVVGTTDTAKYADVLLPAAGWAEKSGTLTNSERRISRARQAIDAPGECLPDWKIVCEVAGRMGWGAQFAYESFEEIYLEHIETTRGRDCDITGLEAGAFEGIPRQWPCTPDAPDGVARLYGDHRFATPDTRARFVVPEGIDAALREVRTAGLCLNTGRMRDHWHTMTKTGRVPELCQHTPAPRAELSPVDAAKLGIRNGDKVRVDSGHGSFELTAEVSADVRAGTVFAPMHWGEEFAGGVLVNQATSGRLDPVSKQPALKQTAVRVMLAGRCAIDPIVIVGTGAAGMALAEELRSLDDSCEIVMVGEEPGAHYNRVLLHEVAAGARTAQDLVLNDHDWFSENRIALRNGVRALRIDSKQRQVELSTGERISYGTLALATGSRPSRLDLPGADLPGVFTLRSLADASAIRGRLAEGPVAIVGSGPLAVELALALREAGVVVSLAWRGERLLRSSVDETASKILEEHMRDQGIALHPGSAPAQFVGAESLAEIELSTGETLACRNAVMAVGTSANNALALTAGLGVNRRIVVDTQMRTSDPGIFALGECAEFEGTSVGLVSVAREQGRVAAAAICGDVSARYEPEPPILALKAPGLEFRASGLASAGDHPDRDELIYHDKNRGVYRKVVLERDRIVGITAVGPFSGFVGLHRRMREALRVGVDREGLLSGLAQGKKANASGPTICSCCSVSAGEIIAAVASGACNAAQIGKATGAGTRCGSCRAEVMVLLEQVQRSQEPMQAPVEGAEVVGK